MISTVYLLSKALSNYLQRVYWTKRSSQPPQLFTGPRLFESLVNFDLNEGVLRLSTLVDKRLVSD